MSRSQITSAGYEYRDRDMLLVNKARNWDRDFDYAWLPNLEKGVRRPSGVLVKSADPSYIAHTNAVENRAAAVPDLAQTAFVRNNRGGIVIDLPAMSLRGAEAGLHRVYLEDAIHDIITLGRTPANNTFPAKIIFPYNPGGGHWIAGEVIIGRNAAGQYSAQMCQYNPMSNQAQNIDADFSRNFCALFQAVARSPLRVENNPLPQIGRESGGRKVVIQAGGVACGVFTAYALDKLKTGGPENMWDGFPPNSGTAALQQRQADEALVRRCADHSGGVITAEELAAFGSPLPASANPAENFQAQEERFFAELKKKPLTKEGLEKLTKEIDSYQSRSKRKIWNQIFNNQEILSTVSAREEILKLFLGKTSAEERAKIVRESDATITGSLIDKISGSHSAAPVDGDQGSRFVAIDAQKTQEQVAKFNALLVGTGEVNTKMTALQRFIEENRGDKKLLQKLATSVLENNDSSNKTIKEILVEMLLEAGTSLPEPSATPVPAAGVTPANVDPVQNILKHERLLQALTDQNLTTVQGLWTKDVNSRYVTKEDGSQILHKVAQNTNADVIKHVIVRCKGNRIDINITNDDGQTPLMMAVLFGNYVAVEELIKEGADITLLDHEGFTAFDLAQSMQALYAEDRGQEKNYNRILEALSKPLVVPAPVAASAPASASAASSNDGEEFNLLENAKRIRAAQDARVEKRTTLSFIKSDFLGPLPKIKDEDLEEQKAARKNAIAQRASQVIEITGDDISFSAVLKEGSKQEKTSFIKAEGKLKDVFEPSSANKDGAFQAYYANFKDIHFKETPGKLIFKDAKLFMANFKKCVFDDVDFSQIPKDIFVTMQFDECAFTEGCKFPKGVKMENIEKPKPGTRTFEADNQRITGVKGPDGNCRPVSYSCLYNQQKSASL